jgi:segregation and condensation protein B
MDNNLDTTNNMKPIVEALLIATDSPLSTKKIIEITGLAEQDIKNVVRELNGEYLATHRAFEIKEIAGGFQIYTRPEFAIWVGALHDRKSKLSKAALETIAIIAYHQPITRPEIEKIRGVDSSWILDTLLQKGLVRTCGRLPVPGRPIKYATTKEFLRYFGIKNLNELPREEDFEERVAHDMAQEVNAPDNQRQEYPDSETDESEEIEPTSQIDEIPDESRENEK